MSDAANIALNQIEQFIQYCSSGTVSCHISVLINMTLSPNTLVEFDRNLIKSI